MKITCRLILLTAVNMSAHPLLGSQITNEISTEYLIQDQSVKLPLSINRIQQTTLRDAWFKDGPACPGMEIMEISQEPFAIMLNNGNFMGQTEKFKQVITE